MPNTKLKIVMLPGLDGTGLLFADLTAALERDFGVQVISYPSQQALSYAELSDYVGRRLPPGEPYLLLGESFSGPVALSIAVLKPAGLIGIVIGASFARLDYPFKFLLKKLVRFVPPGLVPTPLLNFLLIGSGRSSRHSKQLQHALDQVAPKVLAARAQQALMVDLVKASIRIDQPLLYLRASKDLVMPSAAEATVAGISRNFTRIEFDSPHFLFQTHPEEVADTIRAFANWIHRAADG